MGFDSPRFHKRQTDECATQAHSSQPKTTMENKPHGAPHARSVTELVLMAKREDATELVRLRRRLLRNAKARLLRCNEDLAILRSRFHPGDLVHFQPDTEEECLGGRYIKIDIVLPTDTGYPRYVGTDYQTGDELTMSWREAET